MPSTLPGPGFVEAVNRNGVKQVIPAAYLEPGSPFANDFRLPPSTVARRGRESGQGAPASDKRPKGRNTETPPSGDDKKE